MLATGAAVAAVAVPAAPSFAAAGDVNCNGVAPPTVAHDLIVPKNTTCDIPSGTQIGNNLRIMDGATAVMHINAQVGNDVSVKKGGSFDDRGGQIGHNVTADHPNAIRLNGGGAEAGSGPSGGSIGNDVNIKNLTGGFVVQTGGGPVTIPNSICNQVIGGHLTIQATAATAAPWSVGDRDIVCGQAGIRVMKDATINSNHNPFHLEDNSPARSGQINGLDAGFQANLKINGNDGGIIVAGNNIVHDCSQGNNHPYSIDDGDGDVPNTAGHKIDKCNTPNA